MEEEGDSNLCIDTDSDTAEKKDSTKCQVKWTQEEVNEKKPLTVDVCVHDNLLNYIVSELISSCVQDENLKILTSNFGKKDWKTIASFLPVSNQNQLSKRD